MILSAGGTSRWTWPSEALGLAVHLRAKGEAGARGARSGEGQENFVGEEAPGKKAKKGGWSNGAEDAGLGCGWMRMAGNWHEPAPKTSRCTDESLGARCRLRRGPADRRRGDENPLFG